MSQKIRKKINELYHYTRNDIELILKTTLEHNTVAQFQVLECKNNFGELIQGIEDQIPIFDLSNATTLLIPAYLQYENRWVGVVINKKEIVKPDLANQIKYPCIYVDPLGPKYSQKNESKQGVNINLEYLTDLSVPQHSSGRAYDSGPFTLDNLLRIERVIRAKQFDGFNSSNMQYYMNERKVLLQPSKGNTVGIRTEHVSIIEQSDHLREESGVFLKGATIGEFSSAERTRKHYPSNLMHGLLSAHCADESGIEPGKSKIVANQVVKFDNENPLYKLLNSKFTEDQRQKAKSANILGWDKINVDINTHLAEWTVVETIDDTETGYLGVIYSNGDHLILAHRSTNFALSFFRNLLKESGANTDFDAVLMGRLTRHQAKAYVITSRAVELAKEFGYTLSITGHSLGAWLADLSVFYCDTVLGYREVKAITFDSPGSFEMMEQMSSGEVMGSGHTFNINELDIVSYLSAPNAVNSINKHVGRVYRMVVSDADHEHYVSKLSESSWGVIRLKEIVAFGEKILPLIDKRGINRALLCTMGHAMEFILPGFDLDTGIPKPASYINNTLQQNATYEEIKQWPFITHSEYGSPYETPLAEKFGDSSKKVIEKELSEYHIPYLVKKAIGYATSKTAYAVASKVVGHDSNTLSSLFYLARDLYNNKIDYDHLLEAHKYLLSPGYTSSANVGTEEEFFQRFGGQYRTVSVVEEVDKIKNWVDVYLRKLYLQKQKGISLPNIKDLHKLLELYKYSSSSDCIISENHAGVKQPIYEVRNKFRQILKDHQNEIDTYIDGTSAQNKYRLSVASKLPLERENIFIDRKEYLSIIGQRLAEDKVVVLRGNGGVGKSSIALEYAYRMQEMGYFTWWIDATSEYQVRDSYKQLALKLGMPVSSGLGISTIISLTDDIKKVITSIKRNTLIILDNLQHQILLDKLVELLEGVNSDYINILVTSGDSLHYRNAITVTPFSKKHALQYIKTSLPDLGNNDADYLATMLALVPQKLERAVVYIKEYSHGIHDYIRAYSAASVTLKKAGAPHNPNLYMLIDRLSINSLEFGILQHLAYITPRHMPYSILQALVENPSIKERYKTEDPTRAIDRLVSLSLGRVSDKKFILAESTTNIMKVYCEVSGKKLYTNISKTLLDTLNSIMPYYEMGSEEETISEAMLYVSYVIEFLKLISIEKNDNVTNITSSINNEHLAVEDLLGVAELCLKVGQYFSSITIEYKEAYSYFRKANEILRIEGDSYKHNLLRSIFYSEMGYLYFNTGYYNLALDVYKSIPSDDSFGIHYIYSRPVIKSSIGLALVGNHRIEEAIPFFKQAVDESEHEIFAVSTSYKVYFKHNLATYLSLLEKIPLEERIKMYNDVLPILPYSNYQQSFIIDYTHFLLNSTKSFDSVRKLMYYNKIREYLQEVIDSEAEYSILPYLAPQKELLPESLQSLIEKSETLNVHPLPYAHYLKVKHATILNFDRNECINDFIKLENSQERVFEIRTSYTLLIDAYKIAGRIELLDNFENKERVLAKKEEKSLYLLIQSSEPYTTAILSPLKNNTFGMNGVLTSAFKSEMEPYYSSNVSDTCGDFDILIFSASQTSYSVCEAQEFYSDELKEKEGDFGSRLYKYIYEPYIKSACASINATISSQEPQIMQKHELIFKSIDLYNSDKDQDSLRSYEICRLIIDEGLELNSSTQSYYCAHQSSQSIEYVVLSVSLSGNELIGVVEVLL